MNYEIELSLLKEKNSEFKSLLNDINSLVDEGESSLNSMNGSEISRLCDTLNSYMEKLKNGYSKCDTWLSEYINDLDEIESSLANFTSKNITSPTEFKMKFEDIFSKRVIPTLKSDRNKDLNLEYGYKNSSTESIKQEGDSKFAIPSHALVDRDGTRAERVAYVGGECGTEAEQDAKMETIQVPYWNGEEVSKMNLTVNKNLVSNYQNAFQKLADMKYTVLPETTGAYNYYHARRPSGAPSDHTLGSAVDLNWDNNWDTGDGSSYSIRGKEAVIEAFASEGFYWGGDWTNPDDMHFTFTGY